VFAAGEAPVRTAHALMGVVNQYYVVGQLTALKAMQVLEGAAPASIPIEAPRRFSFLVNLRVAKQLELYPPMKLIRFAEFIK
jgi:putative ABC transport system substrate-binding protein